MTQIRGGTLPADVAKTDKSNVWTGTQDFTGATVLGISGGGGSVSGATPTTAGVIELAGDLAGTYQAPTVAKINGATPAAVATSGQYTDLTGRPALAAVATSGQYNDLTGRPPLATVAISGQYTDLSGLPALKTVATSGAYTDLIGRPALAAVATSGAYSDLTGTPTVPTVYLRGKTSDYSMTSTTAVADPTLQVAGLPAGTYAVEASLLAVTGSTVTTNITFSLPSGATFNWTGLGSTNGAVATGGTGVSQLTMLTGLRASIVASSLVVTTPGTFGLMMASTTGGSIAGLGANSWLRLTKMA